jgi:hypothetical protein
MSVCKKSKTDKFNMIAAATKSDDGQWGEKPAAIFAPRG